jgi:RNA methyltransferase, TrmH family
VPSLNEKKRIRALRRRKGRDAEGLFLAEGVRVVRDLLDAGRPVALALYTEEAEKDPEAAPLVERLRGSAARTERVAAEELSGYADTATPQGLLVVAGIPLPGWDDLRSTRLLVLDGVQDPGNLGTLVRTAEALGAGGVLCLEGTTDPWGAKAVRAAAGSSLRLPVLRVGRAEAIAGLAERAIPLWASAADGEPLRRGEPRPESVALAVGNEGAGISDAVRRAAARVVAIEQVPEAESLNVAVAAALLMDRIFGGDGDGIR